MKDLITVIIPCYQQGRFLPEALSSIQAQTYPYWEVIIVNDGSSDETESIAKSLCSTDCRVSYLSQPNRGLSSARNVGLAHAQGQWVQFLDADDLLLPLKFERHIETINCGNRCSITYSNYFHGAHDAPNHRVKGFRVSHELRMPRPILDVATRWQFDFSIPIHAALFPAWLFKDRGVHFDQALPNHEDWDMWMQVLPHVSKLVLIPEELAIYRVSSRSMSRDKSRMWRGFIAAIEKQKNYFQFDLDVIRGLNYLAEMNDYSYHHGLRGNIKRVIDSRIFRHKVLRLIGSLIRPIVHPREPKYSSQFACNR